MEKKKVYKILVVDNDPLLLDITVRILKKTEHKVFTAINGTECMQLLKKEKPEIILLDVMLSDAKGKDICKKIKSDPEFSSVYIILISAFISHANDVSEGLEAGVDDYIKKPVDSRELLAHVRSAVRLISAEEKNR